MATKLIDVGRLSGLLPSLSGKSFRALDGPFAGSEFNLSDDCTWSTSTRLFPLPRDRADFSLAGDECRTRLVRPSPTVADSKSGVSGLCIRIEYVADKAPGNGPLEFRTYIPLRRGSRNKVLFPDGYDTTGGGGAEYRLPLVIRGTPIDVFLLHMPSGEEVLVLEYPSVEARAHVNAIRQVLTFLTGISLRGPSADLVAESGARSAHEVTWLSGTSLEKNHLFYRPIPSSWGEWADALEALQLPRGSHPLAPDVVGRCVERLLDRPGLVAPMEYLTRFQDAPVEMRGAFMSVALEALTSDLVEQGLLASSPPLEKAPWQDLRAALLGVLEQKASEGSWGADAVGPLRARILNLNGPTNAQKLTQPFQVLGIELSDEEVSAIKRRNDLLHRGRLLDPDRIPRDGTAWREAYVVEMHLLTAVYKLMLRSLGYCGAMIDWGRTPIETPEQAYTPGGST